MKTKITWLAAILMAASVLLPQGVVAAALASRTVTLDNSAAGASTSYHIQFTMNGSQTLGAFYIQICDSPLAQVSCAGSTTSAGASFGSATLGSVTAGFGSGWTVSGGTAASGANGTSILVTPSSPAASASGSVTIVLNNVTNPSATNTSFYLRTTTYTDSAGTTPSGGTDFGAVALSTATPIVVNAIVQEQLAFATGTSGTCGSLTGNTVDLGILTSSTANTGTSLMCASTNATSGYNITVNGTTLTSGSNTITAMGTQTLNSSNAPASAPNSPQFGMNLVANTTPAVGADVDNTGGGIGTAVGGYNAANGFRFFSGDTVAESSGATANSFYTVTYLANINPTQQAGIYTTTLTYICTGTF